MIKAVIFDWGGVVAEERAGGWLAAFGELVGLEGDELKATWSYAYDGLSSGQINLDDFWARVKEKINIELPKSKNDIWFKGLTGAPWREVIEYAKSL